MRLALAAAAAALALLGAAPAEALKPRLRRSLARKRALELDLVAVNRDSGGGAVTKTTVALRSPV